MKETVYQQRRRNKDGSTKLTSVIVRRIPTQQQLMDLLHYDPEAGVFTHKQTRGKGKEGEVAGGLNRYGYIDIRLMNRLFKAHQLAFLYMTGSFPEPPLTVDHINGCRTDNRWCNLRLATQQEQTWNRTAHKNNKSGLMGAWPCKTTGRWQSLLTDGKSRKWLGRFDTAQEAHEAWIKMATELRGAEWVERALSS